MNDPRTTPPPHAAAPAGSPFRNTAFTVIWVATVVSNIGGWMYNVASGWLMTSLDPNALIVSMVQVANSLPMFLFAIPAGALADIVNQRRFLIFGESAITIVSTAFAALVWLRLITPGTLLVFSFVVTIGSAMTAPAWQSVVAKLVPKQDLPGAVAANSVGINVSRAIGPALGGIIVAALGIAAPFWLDAVSNIGVIAALIWWRAPEKSGSPLPPEPFGSAVRTGLRYARYNSYLSATLIRTIAFFVFGSAYWALLPARRADSDRRRPRPLRSVTRRDWRRCRGRCVSAAPAQGKVRSRFPRCGCQYRHRASNDVVCSRSPPSGRNRCQPHCRRFLDRRCV